MSSAAVVICALRVKLNKVISRGFVKSYSTHKLNCGNFFLLKIVSFCTPHIFAIKMAVFFLGTICMFEILSSVN